MTSPAFILEKEIMGHFEAGIAGYLIFDPRDEHLVRYSDDLLGL